MLADTMRLHRDAAGHVVQFYASEDELTTSVGAYLLDALRNGGVAIVVATPTHAVSFAAELAAGGVKVTEAQANGSFVVLDARHTMHRFLVGDQPDPAAFESVIGSVIRRAIGTGRPVHVFGEMVALMWDAGQVNAAIDVEQLWNELGERLPFALYCAYSTQSTSGEFDREAVREVCRLHSTVVGPSPAAAGPAREIEHTFAGVPNSARLARHFVIDTLLRWGDGALIDDAALVVTELASNAVRYTASEFTVTISSSSSRVRIAVGDSSVVPAVRCEPTPTATSGRGLAMVAAVSGRWRCEPDAHGKVVWAELRRL